MDIPVIAWVCAFLTIALTGCVFIIWRLFRRTIELRSRTKSIYTKHGLMAEQFLPFSRQFPGDPRNFRFLGSPIDGVSFEDDKILIVEFKTGRSQLSPKQRRIKELIGSGKVYFKEIRVPG